MTPSITRFRRLLRRWALPLWCYYAVTLAVPLLNGAAAQGVAFVSHALIVLAFPLGLVAAASVCGYLGERIRTR
jgi:hypothetical protein